MSRHNQTPKKRDMTCPSCKAGDCTNCLDILRAVYTDEMICTCTKQNHTGEAVDNQIVDPFDGSVHAPGLTVSADGKVKFRDNR